MVWHMRVQEAPFVRSRGALDVQKGDQLFLRWENSHRPSETSEDTLSPCPRNAAKNKPVPAQTFRGRHPRRTNRQTRQRAQTSRRRITRHNNHSPLRGAPRQEENTQQQPQRRSHREQNSPRLSHSTLRRAPLKEENTQRQPQRRSHRGQNSPQHDYSNSHLQGSTAQHWATTNTR